MIYPLGEVLLLCLLAVLGGAETFVDIARFGKKKIGLFRRLRPFRDGTPSHDPPEIVKTIPGRRATLRSAGRGARVTSAGSGNIGSPRASRPSNNG